MADIEAALIVEDVPAGPAGEGGPLSTVTNVIHNPKSWAVTWKLMQPESGGYQVTGPDAVLLTPGDAPGGCRVVSPSLDGGVSHESRFISNGASLQWDLPPYVQEQCQGLLSTLGQAHIHRWVAQQVILDDVINGLRNQIRTQDSRSIIAPGGILPDMQGIANTPIGLPNSQQESVLHPTYIVDPVVANLVLNIDINRDSVLSALEHIVERMGAATDPERAQFVLDSGDFGVDGSTPMSVTLGHIGAASAVTIDGVSTDDLGNPLLRSSTAQAQVTDMCASASFLGGSSMHGLPDGAQITGMTTLNNRTSDATGNYRSGIPVVSYYVNRDEGGVAFWPGDGAFHPMSQSMGVNFMWYDEARNFLYVGTDAGVYYHSSDPGDSGKWGRMGDMALKVRKVQRDGGQTYCLTEWVDGSTHILMYDGIPNATGIGGWHEIHAASGISDFVIGGGKLYYSTSNAGTDRRVYVRTFGSTATEHPIDIPGPGVDGLAPSVVGLDAVTFLEGGSDVTGFFIRTSDGSSGLYYVQAGTTAIAGANSDNTLKDRFGVRLKVNRITQCGNHAIEWSTGTMPVMLFAATNCGVYVSPNSTGGNWFRTDGQSVMGDVDVTWAASAPPRTWLGRILTRVYATTNSAFWVSHNGTVHWQDATASLLDAGPAFAQLWRESHGQEFPDNISAKLDITGADGTAYELWRQLDESTGSYTYTLYNMASTAPAGAHRFAEINQLSIPALLNEAEAALILLDAKARFLGLCAKAQSIVEAASVIEDTADPKRFLRPSHLVTLQAAMEMCMVPDGLITLKEYDGVVFKVLEHTISVNENEPGIARTLTRMGTYLLDSRTDPNRVVGDLAMQASRIALYARQT